MTFQPIVPLWKPFLSVIVTIKRTVSGIQGYDIYLQHCVGIGTQAQLVRLLHPSHHIVIGCIIFYLAIFIRMQTFCSYVILGGWKTPPQKVNCAQGRQIEQYTDGC